MTLTCSDVRDLAAGFVLGALEPAEAAAVREHLATCTEAHAEVEELGGVVPYLADSVEPVEPSAGLRARLLAAATERTVASSSSAATPNPTPRPTPLLGVAERGPRSLARPGTWGGWALRIAAVIAIIALGASNVSLQGRLNSVEDSLAAARAYQDGVAAVLAVATKPGSTTALLAPAEGAAGPVGIAAVAADGSVVLSMRDLPATAGAQVYEAWVIAGSGAPVPIGGFTTGEAGTAFFRTSSDLAGPGAVLALTLEPGPGATTPTLPIVALGAVAGAG